MVEIDFIAARIVFRKIWRSDLLEDKRALVIWKDCLKYEPYYGRRKIAEQIRILESKIIEREEILAQFDAVAALNLLN